MPYCTVASDSTVMTLEEFECGASVTECKTVSIVQNLSYRPNNKDEVVVYYLQGVYPQGDDSHVMGPSIAIESNNLNPLHSGNTYKANQKKPTIGDNFALSFI